jgi:putative DNA primase/helicase
MFEFFADRKHVFIADNDDSKTGEKEATKACQYVRKNKGQAEVLMPETKGDYNDHKNELEEIESVEGEVIPAMQKLDLPTEYDFQRSAAGRFLNTKDNINGVMKTHEIEVRYNVIKKRMEIEIPNMNFIADMKEEASLIEIEDRCINMGIPHTKVRDYLKILAKEYNPVKEWINSAPWDGRDRLQAFLDSLVTHDSNQLKEMLMKKWLISCVAAAYEVNGVELEGILVLQGAQGLGKTLWFKRLCDYDRGWLLEGATLNPSDKDSVKRAVSHWIVELGEIESTFKKSDIDQLKAFVTAKTDELRLPYDRAFTTYQRRTAFYASVNAREFLTDTSGNRRFWVLAVKDIDVNHGVDMQQLWAQVKETMYVQGQKNWFLSPDERELLNESNEIYRTQSSVEDLLLEHVDFESDNIKPVQMTKLLRDLGIKAPRMPDFKEAARVLHERGIEPRRSNGKKVYDMDYKAIDDNGITFGDKF